jgi:membrane protease YdiL (CAAX protease family)
VDRIDARDKKLMLAAALVALLSVAYVLRHYRAAFPQASLDLRYSKSEITSMAERFLASRHLPVEGFRNLTLFDPDDRARLYLERELGLEQANRLMEERVPVWRWRARWFRPPGKEELVVYLSPGGRLVGFRHVIAEAAPGARLSRDQARAAAEEFLRTQTAAPHRLIEEQLEERPARHDHIFTWEEAEFRARDATLRRKVVIQGDQVGEYSEYLHIPEQWQRDFAALRSSNELFQWAAEAGFAALFVAAVVVLLGWLRRRAVPWKPLVGLCAAVGVLMILNQGNTLAFFIDRMPTSAPYHETVAFGLLQAIGAGVGVFFYVIVAAAAGEPLYRRAFPRKVSLPAMISRRGLRTKEFFLACVAGYALAAAHIAFVVAFYLLGRRFGAWSPQDVAYSDLLSTAAPWLYPFTISLLAATSEEFWFRLLAIPLLQRYLRWNWLAVIVPAFVWGFLHSNYPQQPGWIRGVEVGLIGVAAGLVMLRWGIVATLVWHYTVDAVFIGMFLFEAGSWHYRLSGAVIAGIVLLPLSLSLYSYRRRGGFETDPALLNEHLELAPPLEAEAAPAPPAPALEPRWPARWLYVAAAVALVVGLLVRPVSFGDFIRVRLGPSQAEEVAAAALRARNLDPGSWRHVVQFVPNLHAAEFEYLRRLGGARLANETVRERTITGVWQVRYFRPLQSEEWRVYVDQQGRAYRLDHILDEKAPGANLPPEEARRRAEAWLAGEQRLPMERYRLVDSSTEKLERRTDHSFVWEEEGFRAGEATARLSLSLVGEDICQYRRFLKLPEQWLREFERPRLQAVIVPALGGAVGLVLLVIAIRRLSGRGAEAHRFRWRFYVAAGALGALLAALSAANEWSGVLAAYDTATPLENFLQQALLNRLIVVLLAAAGMFLLAMAADVFLQIAYGYRDLPLPSAGKAAAAAALLWGLWRALEFIGQLAPGDRLQVPLWSLTGADTAWPALAVLSRSLSWAFGWVCGLTILAGAVVRYLWSRPGAAIVAAAAAVAALSRSTNVWQWLFHLAAGAALAALVWLLVRTCGADLVSFGVAGVWLEAAGRATELILQPAPSLRANGLAALVLAGALGLAVLSGFRRLHSKNFSPGLR